MQRPSVQGGLYVLCNKQVLGRPSERCQRTGGGYVRIGVGISKYRVGQLSTSGNSEFPCFDSVSDLESLKLSRSKV